MEPEALQNTRTLLEMLERVIGEPGNLTSTLQHITETAQHFFSADACVIYAINPITDDFVEGLILESGNTQILRNQPRPGRGDGRP